MDLRTELIMEMVKGLLHILIDQKDYFFLKELYDYLELYDNKKIMAMHKKNPKLSNNPKDGIFEDIISIIVEEVCHNEGLLEKIIQHYLRKYPFVKEVFDKNSTDFNKYRKEGSRLTRDDETEKNIFCLLYYFVYGKNDPAKMHNILQGLKTISDYGGLEYKTYTQDLGICWGIDNLDEDKLYKKYLKKQRKVLTDYLGIEPDKLEFYLLKICAVFSKGKRKYQNNKLYIVEESLFKIMDKYTIPANCVITIQKNIDYHQIVKENFESLCGALVFYKYLDYAMEGRKLEHSMLMFHVEMENPEAFFQILVASFYFELLTIQFNDMIAEYYKNFSFDKFLGTNQQKELIQQIEKLKAELEEKKGIIAHQNEQAFNSRQKEYAEAQKENNVYEKQISKLNRQIDSKDDTIKNLKRQLEIKDEYIALLSKEDDDKEGKIDISLLQTRKYLFVGDAKEALPELKKTFPNSLFMETETYTLKNIKVDCVVMLIKYMSHTMFYKIKSTSALKDVPMVMCNTKNVNTIYRKMMENTIN